MSFNIVPLICIILTVCAYDIKLSCPPPTTIPVCEITCKQGLKCLDHEFELCCPTACGGTICQRGVTIREKIDYVKNGTCPDNPHEKICTNQCNNHLECKRNLICCLNACGHYSCMEPAPETKNYDDIDYGDGSGDSSGDGSGDSSGDGYYMY